MNLKKIGVFQGLPKPLVIQDDDWEFPVKQEKAKLKLSLKKDIEEPTKKKLLLKKRVIKEYVPWDGVLVNTKDIPDLTYPFETLNPPQSEFYHNRFLDRNFIISAATSAGKTVIAELANDGKFMYLSPLKAISQEKRDDWTDPGHLWSTKKVAICTGDYMLTADRVQELKEAEVVVMTSEMLDSRSRNMLSERNDWLMDIKTLVIDEFHLIGYEGRGDKLESALIRFSAQNPNCRIICLSATMPNIQEIAEWLTKLNGKETVAIESTYRPVSLIKEYIPYKQSKSYKENENAKIVQVIRIVKENPEDKFIVFVHTKATGSLVQMSLKASGIKCEYHNADLGKDERIRIQKEFNNRDKGSLRVLVATSTLAWGVNTPADSVIVTGLHRGMSLISNQDVHQMCGRAGRVGKTSKGIGTAYILIPNNDFEHFKTWCEKISDIKSKMRIDVDGGLETLCFHIIAEVLNEGIKHEEGLLTWYNRTLAKYQGVELSLNDAIQILNTLESIKCVKKDPSDLYSATGLGRVSAYLYYSPFDIYGWFRNFCNLIFENKKLGPLELSWALGNVDGYDAGFISTAYQEEADKWLRLASSSAGLASVAPQYSAAYYHLLKGTEDYPVRLFPLKRHIQMDFDRILSALKLIDKLHIRWNKHELWNQLGLQIRYGVGPELIELVKIPKIGAKRAGQLYDAHIRNIEDFKNKEAVAKGIIGKELYRSILEELKKSRKI